MASPWMECQVALLLELAPTAMMERRIERVNAQLRNDEHDTCPTSPYSALLEQGRGHSEIPLRPSPAGTSG
jgi:hypothetical protein